ncbi:hypothetical protein M430DRAFT_32411 [Amorphotheca resinae ATCC 22711]|uniref:Uncharacterized protein n=1 Tax=Amorphotheca resinae ATCC 22711 TaxID=857342 RepID=A0A2T3BEI5_AMORE|nr:hypothetical protein M430DRAFT_32411 [Amorphotheca resinae ATCC 22711]PSS27830.1 hypothetical protein M430DRAFT_32411 [Amorphotheca resinae ATCC 22711]
MISNPWIPDFIQYSRIPEPQAHHMLSGFAMKDLAWPRRQPPNPRRTFLLWL